MDIRLIIDLSQIAHATWHTHVKLDKEFKNEEERFAFWKYLMLNKIGKARRKFQPDETILAIDSGSWRKSVFKYYKARRVLKRDNSNPEVINFFRVLNEFIVDIEKHFPYKVVKANSAEADDVVGILTHHLSPKSLEVVIVSGDHDFQQLLKLKNVSIYDPIQEKMVNCSDPDLYLIHQVMRGDGGDDIPNIMSDDDVFLDENKRQKNCGPKKIDAILADGLMNFLDQNPEIKAKFERNKKIIELSPSTIPTEVQEGIMTCYNTPMEKDPALRNPFIAVMQYIRRNRMKSLEERIGEFL